MKNEMILAFKKQLSQIVDFNEINIKNSTAKYFGGYEFIKFHNFTLVQMLWVKNLMFKDTKIDLEHNEWLELKNLVEEKKEFLQKTNSCNDYVEIMKILNS